jgi:hypothetical protein
MGFCVGQQSGWIIPTFLQLLRAGGHGFSVNSGPMVGNVARPLDIHGVDPS